MTKAIVCAWCGKGISGSDPTSRPITHGICASCADRFEHPSIPMSELLDEFTEPIFLIGPDMRARAGNQAACRVVGKAHEEFEGRLGGEVIDCVYSRLPDGCGSTVHCDGCSIRRGVTRTLKTGAPISLVTAERPVTGPRGSVRNMRFLVSTEKLRDGVRLRVDEVEEAD